jgi:GH15 family glucan-1,4-alpha-glucosidase
VGYQPIAGYGIIGDLHSVALVGRNGSIDWCCLPRFDSPSVFGALLDDQKGGSFSLRPADDDEIKQIYLPNTNVLLTRFLHENGMAEVIDFMAIGRESGGETEQDSRQLVRIARATRGDAKFRMMCRPAFDYAREPAQIRLEQDGRPALLN